MPEFLDDIAYLSQEIGPRPAGTEEEQQAALYISDRFKKRAGLRSQIEDFSCNSNPELVFVILSALPIILSILSMVRNIFVVPTILVTIVCAVLFVLEVLQRPVLSRVFQRGVSQNVIAKYRPEWLRGKRTRKVIVVANYDSDKVRNELGFSGLLPLLQKASTVSIVLIPIIWAIRAVAFLGATGTALIAWNIITVIVIVLAALPIVLFIMHNTAQYNEAANSNASGVAALIEVANRIANTPVYDDDTSEAEIYGEEAAREAGLIPDGAQVDYRVKSTAESETTETDRLNAAKAAVEALTGKPLREYAPQPESEIRQQGYAEEEPPSETLAGNAGSGEQAAPDGAASGAAGQVNESVGEQEQPAVTEGDDNSEEEPAVSAIPDWYVKAQEKAQKGNLDEKPVRRSKFASALDEAVAVSHEQFAAANLATDREESFFDEHFNDGINPVPAPAEAQQAVPLQQRPAQQNPADSQHDQEPAKRRMTTEEEIASINFEDYADLPPFDMDWYAPKPGDEYYEETIAADFMVERPAPRQASEEEQTAPIPAVAHVESSQRIDGASTVDDGYVPGSTTAMPPIDVSQLRSQAVRNLQAKPSLNVEHAQRRNVDRVVIDATEGESPAVAANPVSTTAPKLDLPDVETDLPPVANQVKQRAPLADASKPSLSAQIPRINLDAFGVSTTGNAQPADNKRAALRNMLPSMSGSITLEPDAPSVPENSGAVSLTGSFAPVSATASVGRVGDELVEGMSLDEMYIDDADDSFTETTMTETGAYAGPGYMEMPESRASRFFGHFHKKKRKSEDNSAQEWLGVDDDFNPTEIGAARGGWESFGEADEGRSRSNRHRKNNDEFLDDEDWSGGAFSRDRSTVSFEGGEEYVEDSLPAEGRRQRDSRRMSGVDFRNVDRDIRQVQDFHAKRMDVEVWFVALGSEYAGNGGMKAFLDEHASDLRGSVIFNLDSLGSGTFTYIDKEGAIRHKSPSSRLRRYLKNAQQASGVSITEGSITWRDSAASIAMKRGLQGMTLAGMDGSKPSMMGRGDDVLENIDVDAMEARIDFIEALVRSV